MLDCDWSVCLQPKAGSTDFFITHNGINQSRSAERKVITEMKDSDWFISLRVMQKPVFPVLR